VINNLISDKGTMLEIRQTLIGKSQRYKLPHLTGFQKPAMQYFIHGGFNLVKITILYRIVANKVSKSYKLGDY